MNRFIKIILVLLIITETEVTHAQVDSLPPAVKIDTAVLAIGDQTHLRITLPLENNKPPIFPDFRDSIGHSLEILNKKVDTIKHSSGKTLITHDYLITSFDTGHIYIPPFEVGLKDNTYNSIIKTDTIKMYVAVPKVDMEKGIFSIKPPADMPFKFSELYPLLKIIGIILAILLLICTLLYFLFFRKKKKEIQTEIVDNRPAHVKAKEALLILKKKELWQKGFVKRYYSELTNTVRVYLDERFNMQTMESTSYEIMRALRKHDINKEDKHSLKRLFNLADIAKFAKGNPQAHENDKSWNDALQFVENSKIEEDNSENKENKDKN